MNLFKYISLIFLVATAVACQAQTEPSPTNTAVPPTETALPKATATTAPLPEKPTAAATEVSAPEAETDSAVVQVTADEPFTLKVEEMAVYDETFITFTAVTEDSRCPKSVTCVWEGQGIVELEVVGVDGQKTQIQLNTNPPDNTMVTTQYEIQLVDLMPYPQTTDIIPQEDYEATLMISTNPE